MTNNRKQTLILSGILILLSSVPLFCYLGSYSLCLWDESRLAASAYEMTQTGNPLVVSFNYQPDHWSLKPPLAIWCQAISIKIFGVNEFAVRFPSSIAVLATCIMLILFFGKLQRPFVGFYASLIMIVSKGIISFWHTCHSADYEALLVFFTTAYCLAFYLFYIFKKKRYLLFFFTLLTLAAMTKGVQALFPLPFIVLFVVFKRGSLSNIFTTRSFYYGLSLFLLVVGGYYFGREVIDSGYVKEVYNGDLGGRYTQTNEGHQHGFWYYLNYIRTEHFAYFFWLLPVSIILNLVVVKRMRNLSLYIFSIAVCYLLVISLSATKTEWYDVPIIPFLSIFVAISLELIHFWIKEKTKLKFLPYIFLIGLFAMPYYDAVCSTRSLKSMDDGWNVAYVTRLKLMTKIANGDLPYRNIKVILYVDNVNENNQDSYFYFYKMRDAGVNLTYRKTVSDVQIGDTLLVNEKPTMQLIDLSYQYHILLSEYDNRIIRIDGIKE